MQAQKIPEAIDTMIEEVQSTHQGAFSYLWEQPAIRALLFPSGGIGLATLQKFETGICKKRYTNAPKRTISK
jgi:hypothetical protein